jgi:hypothetical protein
MKLMPDRQASSAIRQAHGPERSRRVALPDVNDDNQNNGFRQPLWNDEVVFPANFNAVFTFMGCMC